ncbi:MAG: formyltransferase family protein, partial [Candidatus Fermentibacteria bacterium]|nr:formyltransferase family protein [Candidatus Fermentibacteria bacterium]
MPFKIVCMGGSEIGYRVAEFLLAQSVEVRFVVNGSEKTGDWYRTPRTLDIVEITEDEIIEYDPDLIIVAFYHGILHENIFTIPRFGCWNLHLGDTELYRGAYPNIHALQNGDTSYAVTLHRIDKDIDSGDILAKSSFPITADTTGKELYFRMVEEGMNLFTRCYPDLASGRALQMTRVQDSSVA